MWKKICGVTAYVEDDRILRGMCKGSTVYPYKRNKLGGYDKAVGVKVTTFRSGYTRETYIWH